MPSPAGGQRTVTIDDASAHREDDRWRLLAIEYARSRDVVERRLVRGAAAKARVDMSWYFFVAIGRGRVVLIDSGTNALARVGGQALRQRWAIDRAVSVTDALGRVGLEASEVTDVVLTHHHWDHVDGLGLFPNATVHVNAQELRAIANHVRQPIVEAGRVRTFSGPDLALWRGLAVREAGLHTRHHTMVEVCCPSRRVIIAGDAAYLYRNIDRQVPVTNTVDPRRNVAAVAAAARSVGARNVIPGHDPRLFERHPSNLEGVAAVCW